jgi:hypothetical protein
VAGGAWEYVARGAAWYRTAGSGPLAALVALLIANAIPIVGVLFLGWSLMTILLLYWLENGIVGLWNVPRIALAGRSEVPTSDGAFARPGLARATLVPFFIFHYGMFWVVHGIFLFVLPFFAGLGFGGGTVGGSGGGSFGRIDPVAIALGGAALFVSHGVSFFANYVGRREYLSTTPKERMFAVYGRVVVLHVTIIFGAIAIGALGSPIAVLLILVVGKTILDLALHFREHTRATATG